MENGHSFNSIRFDKKLYQTVRGNGLIHELTKKIHSHQRYIDIRFYLKHRIPMMYRHFFRKISQKPE